MVLRKVRCDFEQLEIVATEARDYRAASIANDDVDEHQTYPAAEAGRLRRLLCDERSPGRDTQLHDREQDPVRVIDPPNPP